MRLLEFLQKLILELKSLDALKSDCARQRPEKCCQPPLPCVPRPVYILRRVPYIGSVPCSSDLSAAMYAGCSSVAAQVQCNLRVASV